MANTDKFLGILTNEELYDAFEEIREMKLTGTLGSGVVRKVWKSLNELFSTTFSLDYVFHEITYEIAKRWHEEGL